MPWVIPFLCATQMTIHTLAKKARIHEHGYQIISKQLQKIKLKLITPHQTKWTRIRKTISTYNLFRHGWKMLSWEHQDCCSWKTKEEEFCLAVPSVPQSATLYPYHFLRLHEASFLRSNVTCFHKWSIYHLDSTKQMMCSHYYSIVVRWSCCTPCNFLSSLRLPSESMNIEILQNQENHQFNVLNHHVL